MARLTFPSDRLVYKASTFAGSGFASSAGSTATVYADAAGTTLADVQNLDGSANATATFTVDSTSRLPLFLGPANGADTLYVKIDAGPVTAIYAVTAGDISSAVGTEVTNRQAADTAHVAAVNPHNVTPQLIGAPNVVVHGATAGTARPAGATFVHWIGSVQPTNATGNDEWSDTTNKLLKRWNGASFDAFGSAAYQPLSVASKIPPRPAETVITDFQSGHGWTHTLDGASADDAVIFSDGSQSLKVTTAGLGTSSFSNVTSPAFTTPLDLTGKILAVKLAVSDPANLSQLALIAASDTGFSNSFNFPFTSGGGGDEMLLAGDWVYVTIPWNPSLVGAPNRANITNLRFTARDTGGGPIQVNVQRIALLDEANEVWPLGGVSFDFDDGYASHSTVAAPYLAKYGWSGTAYPIVDRIDSGTNGGTTPWMTTPQVQALQNTYGWTVGVHANTQVNHDAGLTTLSSAAQAAELAAARVWLSANGLRGLDYMAYPRGMFNDTLIGNVSRVCVSARTTYRRWRESWPPGEPYKIRAVSVLATDTLASLKTEIDNAAAGRYWLILTFHDLVTSGATVNQWLQSDFQALVDYAATAQVYVRNVEQVMQARPKAPAKLGVIERDLGDGQETFPRLFAATPNTPGSGTMRVTYFTARKTEKVSSVRAYTGGTAASAITLSRVGLYSVAADGTLTLIGSTANDTALFSATSTTYTKALQAATQVYTGQRYAIAPLIVATTAPNLYGLPAVPTNELAQSPRITGAVTGQADLPATVAPGSVVTSGFSFYFALLPH